MGWPLILSGIIRVSERLVDARARREAAENESERIQADRDIARLEARRDALTTGQANWVAKVVQAAFALPFIVYLWKVVIWDKVLKLGVTDGLSGFAEYVGYTVIGFYFLKLTGEGLIARVRKK